MNAIGDQAAAHNERLDAPLDRHTEPVGVPVQPEQGQDAAGDAVHERQEAALDREVAGRLERVGQAQDRTAGPGAGADERDLAARLQERAEGHDAQAAAKRPYARARAGELRDVPAAAAGLRGGVPGARPQGGRCEGRHATAAGRAGPAGSA